ncbi:MAG TPA: AI-2E family transporter [Aliidongia sp.]|nr:AI-2E family transporter [Aliidongia sp.]
MQAWIRSLFWIGIVAALILALTLLSRILPPFVMGAAIAFFLDPAVDRMERMRIPRTVGTVLALVGFLTIIGLFILLLVPLLQAQITQFVTRFPTYLGAGRAQLDHLFELLEDRLPPEDMQRLRDAASAKVAEIAGGAGQVLTGLLTGGVAVANLLSLILITPVVAFFLLRDWHMLVAEIDSWLPRQHLHTIREQMRLVQETLSGFLRGQAAVCALLGMFYAAGLTLIGLDFGLVLGLCVGLLIFIPFLGGLTGAVIAIGLAFAQFGDWHRPLYIAILFTVGQGLEGNIITPKLVGDRVHLHPVWIIFALLAFGELFGFVGVLLAVPVTAVLGVLVRFALKRYLLSPLYDPLNGRPADPAS